MDEFTILSIAVMSGKAGYILLTGPNLQDWGITVRSTASVTEIAGFTQDLINDLRPDVVVTEECDQDCRKGRNTKALIASVASTASHNYVLDVSVPRPRQFSNKYEEAECLVQSPDIPPKATSFSTTSAQPVNSLSSLRAHAARVVPQVLGFC